MLKPSLQLRIGQQLTMTPQLQQAIRLLQLPSLDLQAHVRETLETNVMLEAEDELALEASADPVREREEPPADEKYAELDGNTTPADQREEPEVEIADEAWGEHAGGPSDTSWSRRSTAAAISAISTVKRCRSSSSSSSSSRSSSPSTSRSPG